MNSATQGFRSSRRARRGLLGAACARARSRRRIKPDAERAARHRRAELLRHRRHAAGEGRRAGRAGHQQLSGAFENVIVTQDWHTAGHVSFASAHAGELRDHQARRLHPGLWRAAAQGSRRGAAEGPGAAEGAAHHPRATTRAPPATRRSWGRRQDLDRPGRLPEAHGIDTVYVCGLATDFCVAWTALDARKAGFKADVIEDALARHRPQRPAQGGVGQDGQGRRQAHPVDRHRRLISSHQELPMSSPSSSPRRSAPSPSPRPRTRRTRSRSARSTATRRSRPSSTRTRRAWSSRSRRSTRPAASSARRSRSSRATTTPTPATRCASPRSWSRARSVDVLAGAFLSNTGLALTDFAKQKKFFFLAGEPLTDKITWQNGNRYTFRLRPGTYMQAAMLVPEAAKLKKKRWASSTRTTSTASRRRRPSRRC